MALAKLSATVLLLRDGGRNPKRRPLSKHTEDRLQPVDSPQKGAIGSRTPEVHPKPVRLLSNKTSTNRYTFVIFRVAASSTTSPLSTEPSTPSSRTLQPKSRRSTVTSWRHRDAGAGGGASTPCGMTRSCKHRTAPIKEFNEYSW